MSDQDSSAYRVLARKYRPDNFDGLIGQDALVKTLQNAITHGRLAHAFVLTGVRGVGKTSTARILAKGLNCMGEDGQGGPTLSPCGICEPCQSIMAGRHVDVLEMDAASNTGVDDVRDIIEGANYRPVSARFKIYIIDEVHMLSKSAFNALLKTLEEPPEAVKFIFATTEIRKVPVTILSRCQRFDLRRVSVTMLANHLQMIAQKESINAEEDALHMIARAAEGSVRDSLSLLDQAAAMTADVITATNVAAMLGHAGDSDVGQILIACMSGEIQAALAAYQNADERGSEPEKIISDMLDLTHYASLHAAGAGIGDLPEAVKAITASLAEQGIAKLGRAWQILLKGHGEVKSAPNARASAQMILIRLAHAAPMPTPAEIIKQLPSAPAGPTGQSTSPSSASPSSATPSSKEAFTTAPSSTGPAPSVSQSASSASTPPWENSNTVLKAETAEELEHSPPLADANEAQAPAINSLADAADLLEAHGEMIMAAHLRNYGRPVSISKGHMELYIEPQAPSDFGSKLAKLLSQALAQPYLVSLSDDKSGRTVMEEIDAAREAKYASLAAHPIVKATLDTFESATITNVTERPIDDINEASISADQKD